MGEGGAACVHGRVDLDLDPDRSGSVLNLISPHISQVEVQLEAMLLVLELVKGGNSVVQDHIHAFLNSGTTVTGQVRPATACERPLARACAPV